MPDSSEQRAGQDPTATSNGSASGRGRGDRLGSELRRLRRAALFFLGCLGVFLALLAIGLYH